MMVSTYAPFWTANPWGTVSVPAKPILSGFWGTSTANISTSLVGNETSFNIYRNNALYTTVLDMSAGFNDTGLTPGTTYKYTIESVNSAGTSVMSDPLYVYPGNKVAFANAEDVVYTAATIMWNVNDYSGWTDIRLSRDGAVLFTTPMASMTPDAWSKPNTFEYSDYTLWPETSYTYTLEVLNGASVVSTYNQIVTTTGTDVPSFTYVSNYADNSNGVGVTLPSLKTYDVVLLLGARTLNNISPAYAPPGYTNISQNAASSLNLFSAQYRRVLRGERLDSASLEYNGAAADTAITALIIQGAHIGWNRSGPTAIGAGSEDLPFMMGPASVNKGATVDTVLPGTTWGSSTYSGRLCQIYTVGASANTTAQSVNPGPDMTTVSPLNPAPAVSSRIWTYVSGSVGTEHPKQVIDAVGTLGVAATVTCWPFWVYEPYAAGYMTGTNLAGGTGASTTVTISSVTAVPHCTAIVTVETNTYAGVSATLAANNTGWGTPVLIYDSAASQANVRQQIFMVPNISARASGWTATFPVSVTGRNITNNIFVGVPSGDAAIDVNVPSVFAATATPSVTFNAAAKTFQAANIMLVQGANLTLQNITTIPAGWTIASALANTGNYFRFSNGHATANYGLLKSISWATTAASKTFNPTISGSFPIQQDIISLKSASGKMRFGKAADTVVVGPAQFAAFGIPL